MWRNTSLVDKTAIRQNVGRLRVFAIGRQRESAGEERRAEIDSRCSPPPYRCFRRYTSESRIVRFPILEDREM